MSNKRAVFPRTIAAISWLFFSPGLLVADFGPVRQVSVSSQGVAANDTAWNCSLSSTGRYLVFQSAATNLVSQNNPGSSQIFLRDRQLSTTTGVSLDPNSAFDAGSSRGPVVDASGRYVVFETDAPLVSADTNGKADIYLRDLQTGSSARISQTLVTGAETSTDSFDVAMSSDAKTIVYSQVTTNGDTDVYVVRPELALPFRVVKLNSGSNSSLNSVGRPGVSADGRYAVYGSFATNLDPAVSVSGNGDVYVSDLTVPYGTGESLVSVPPSGQTFADGSSSFSAGPSSISSDGRYVLFILNDVSGDQLLYVRDRLQKATLLVSALADGKPASGSINSAQISGNGRYIVFDSTATNLVPQTTPNGGIFFWDRDAAASKISLVDEFGSVANYNDMSSCISADGLVVGYSKLSGKQLFIREQDQCPLDPNKEAPGVCGCGVPDVDVADTDGDKVPNCLDLCVADPLKVTPGVCGCGSVESADTDADKTLDCVDLCPSDPLKVTPQVCGCGNLDTDSDKDGTPDCKDACPADAAKIAAGTCGCGITETNGLCGYNPALPPAAKVKTLTGGIARVTIPKKKGASYEVSFGLRGKRQLKKLLTTNRFDLTGLKFGEYQLTYVIVETVAGKKSRGLVSNVTTFVIKK